MTRPATAPAEARPDDDPLADNSPFAIELPYGKRWSSLTRRQRQNRIDTLDPGIKPGGLRERLMRGGGEE
jgi:hypothetical protein